GVAAWEVWNEPNIAAFWSPKPDPVLYARLLAAAAAAIRETDPHALVLSGGLATASDRSNGRTIAPETFLAALYRRGVRHTFDAVAVHPYAYTIGNGDTFPP